MHEPILLIGGPTAAGKSAVAVALARALNGEVLNADSQQVYRRMDVGTGKPTEAERAGIPHHLFDLCEPWEQLDAAQWMRRADADIAAIRQRGHLPVVVGGTGLWLRALVRGLVDAPPRDEAFRAELVARAAVEGWPALHAELQAVDSDSAAKIHPTDPIRITRALEIARSGVTQSALHAAHAALPPRYKTIHLGIDPGEVLASRIEARVRAMFSGGLIDEVDALLADPRAADRLLRTIGYKESAAYRTGQTSLEDAIQGTFISTRQYAKRQRTWFKSESAWTWWKADDTDSLLRHVESALSRAGGGR